MRNLLSEHHISSPKLQRRHSLDGKRILPKTQRSIRSHEEAVPPVRVQYPLSIRPCMNSVYSKVRVSATSWKIYTYEEVKRSGLTN